MSRTASIICLVVVSSLLASLAAAESPPPAATRTRAETGYGLPVPFGAWVDPPARRLVLSNLLAGRYNSLGIHNQLRFGVQDSLYHSNAEALRNNFTFLGVSLKLTPSSVKVGPSFEIQPLSVFKLRVSAEWMRYFKTFNSFQSFRSPVDDYSDSTMSRRTDDNLSYSTSGAHVILEPSLQVRFAAGKNSDGSPRLGFIVLRDRLSVDYWHMSLHSPESSDGRRDTVWYDISFDTLVPGDGWALQNDLDFMLQTKINLTVGARYTVVSPLYSRAVFRSHAEADAYDNDNGYQRLGPIVAFTFIDRAYTRFNRPTLLLVVNWFLDHRWRTGRDISAAIPYILLGFSFQCDFLRGPPIPLSSEF